MKSNARIPASWLHYLTAIFALACIAGPSIAYAAGGVIDQSIDALYNLHDQLQDVVTKSVKPVAEAMQEGPSPDNNGSPWTLNDLQKVRNDYADGLKQNQTLIQQQQQLANVTAQLLSKLPKDDPRRAALSTELKQVASQMPDTRKQIQDYTSKLAEADAAINQWRQRHDPNYVPPKTTTAAPPVAAPPQSPPPPPPEPPKTDNGGTADTGGGSTDDLAALKQKEADQEAAARALGQQRVSAVNKYLDDPSAENRAAAEDLRHQLDGMVEDLNNLRNQVDVLEGTSRPPLHVRSAKSIAKQHRKRRSSGQTQPGGSASGAPGSEAHHHAADGSDSSGGYQDMAPGGGSGSAGGSGKNRKRRRTDSNVGSSESHHKKGAGMSPSKQKYMPQQKSRQLQQQQQLQKQKQQQQLQQHQQQIQQQQFQQQQRRKRKLQQ